MKTKLTKLFIAITIIMLSLNSQIFAHGGNISGWKDKNSDEIIQSNGKYYGHHKENGKTHYHEVKWNEEKSKWEIVKSAVYYDENLNVISTENTSGEKVQVTLKDTVDGDTAKFIMDGKTITARFLGIDTPETVHPDKGVEAYGPEASNYTKETLTNAKTIELEFDNKADKQDKYNRYLVWVWADGKLVQEELIKQGLASTYMLQDNYNYAARLQEAEETAKEGKIGIWSTDNNNKNQTNNKNSTAEVNTEKTLGVKEENKNIDNNKREEYLMKIIILVLAIILSTLTMKMKNNKGKKKK